MLWILGMIIVIAIVHFSWMLQDMCSYDLVWPSQMCVVVLRINLPFNHVHCYCPFQLKCYKDLCCEYLVWPSQMFVVVLEIILLFNHGRCHCPFQLKWAQMTWFCHIQCVWLFCESIFHSTMVIAIVNFNWNVTWNFAEMTKYGHLKCLWLFWDHSVV